MNSLCTFLTILILFGTCLLSAQTPADSLTATTVAEAQMQEQEKKKAPAVLEELDEQPTPTKTAAPKYPKTALADTLEGTVYLRVTIDPRGAVSNVAVEKGVREDLNTAAIEAMKQWAFKPPTAKGKPVQTTVVVPFRFRLSKEKK